MLVRGQYDKPADKVTAGIPASLSPPPTPPTDRLGLAEWIVSPSNPLTARVTVNRFWQLYFGRGLVKTAEDFGIRGELPTHPELLDWLATEFVESGWDVKALQKLIVKSAVYRQSSKMTGPAIKRDPENVLLARAPRFRLPAEMIRDQALAVGGLLSDKMGGPSVKPYQPRGLWQDLYQGYTYEPASGENLYRRSLYTFWRRTIPPPSMSTLDAPNRETCTVSRARTNTLLQALMLMNDVTFVEAARLLAERMLKEGGRALRHRLEYGFRLVLARKPSRAERTVLMAALKHHLRTFRRDKEAAEKLVAVGESARDEMLDVSLLAAYTAVGSVILNLDKTITRE